MSFTNSIDLHTCLKPPSWSMYQCKEWSNCLHELQIEPLHALHSRIMLSGNARKYCTTSECWGWPRGCVRVALLPLPSSNLPLHLRKSHSGILVLVELKPDDEKKGFL